MAEFLARTAFDTVTLDMQHGCRFDRERDARRRRGGACRQAGDRAHPRRPLRDGEPRARFRRDRRDRPDGEFARRCARLRRIDEYPPLGERSWGPTRVLALKGISDSQAYLASANRETLAIAMIETKAALAAVDDIIGVEGIDGIFVGPSDFSIAMSGGARVDATDETMLEAAGQVVAKARKAGRFACIFASSPQATPRYREMGFRLVALSTDFGYLAAGAAALLAAAKT